MKYAIAVVYTQPQSHGQTRQTYNADTLEQAATVARREFGKPLVKHVSISVELEHWQKIATK